MTNQINVDTRGVLTVQEAWDLAAFIAGQCRPGKTCTKD